jgi:hypothetical protein
VSKLIDAAPSLLGGAHNANGGGIAAMRAGVKLGANAEAKEHVANSEGVNLRGKSAAGRTCRSLPSSIGNVYFISFAIRAMIGLGVA